MYHDIRTTRSADRKTYFCVEVLKNEGSHLLDSSIGCQGQFNKEEYMLDPGDGKGPTSY